MEILEVWKKYSGIMQNALNANKWERIWFLKTLKIDIQKERLNTSAVLQNWFPSPLPPPPKKFGRLYLICGILKVSKNVPESWRMYWNLMNKAEYGSFKILKMKYWNGQTNNSTVLQNFFPNEIRCPVFNLWKF